MDIIAVLAGPPAPNPIPLDVQCIHTAKRAQSPWRARSSSDLAELKTKGAALF